MFLPKRCGCGELGAAPCYRCWSSLAVCPVACLVELTGEGLLDAVAVPYLYEGSASTQIRAMKYHRHRALVPWAASALVRAFRDITMGPTTVTEPAVVTWVPASTSGVRDRGFDQGRLLATAAARLLALPVHRLLGRDSVAAQTAGGRVERLGAQFSPRWPRGLTGPGGVHVLVVDDVITTGASMRAAALALRSIGVGAVTGAAIARTDRSASGLTSIGIQSTNGSQNQHSQDRIDSSP